MDKLKYERPVLLDLDDVAGGTEDPMDRRNLSDLEEDGDSDS